MKKGTIIIVAVVAIIAIWAISGYNSLVSMDENVSGQWSNVETQYQRRADLIPNLVNTVKGYAAHEKETLEGVIAARSQATQIKVDPTDLTPEKLAEYQKAQGAITSALGKLLAIRLKAVALKTYGSGNAPQKEWFIKLLAEATSRGIVIVNISQCQTGMVEMGRYETGLHLLDAGVISGYDSTVESVLTKLMFLLGHGLSPREIRNEMSRSIAGEFTKPGL